MSEPTPLSAEQPYSRDELVHLAENMRHPTVQQIVGATGQKTINRLLATIDAQATEIAILKDGRCVSCMEPVNPLHPKCACIRAEIAEMEAEIAALKGALESIEDAWAKLVEPGWQNHVASLKGADAPEASHAWVKHIFTFQLAGFRARVLAGKEAQG